MKIKKMYQGTVPENKIVNTYTESQTDTYGCDYVNKLQEVVLYDDESGSSDTITLSETSENFKYLEIFYYSNVSGKSYDSLKIYKPNDKNVNINSVVRDTTQAVLFMYSTIVKISETTITPISSATCHMYVNSSNNFADTNNLLIVRVVGYR